MINDWVPAPTQANAIDSQLLLRFAAAAEAMRANADAVRSDLGDDVLSQVQGWLKLPEDSWKPVIRSLPETVLFPLATFFTLAENAFSGWQCGARNPAIWIFRYLKESGQLPEKTAIRELKSLTDNRFIPYGSAL
ncbi:hypothetical protein ACQUQU_03705 [Thalassolituus sp. LLYu03]|uniref:hypothetical protein n=1 Tax=Thalassolituus sp. LLYu03 TaxID=3421656 RepID=UPI003D2ABD98